MTQVRNKIILKKFWISIFWRINSKSVCWSGILVSVMMLMESNKLLMSWLRILSKCSDSISFILRKVEKSYQKVHGFWFCCLWTPEYRSESKLEDRCFVKLRIWKINQLFAERWFSFLLHYLTHFSDRYWVLCLKQIPRINSLLKLKRQRLSLIVAFNIWRSILISGTSVRKGTYSLIAVHVLIWGSRIHCFIWIIFVSSYTFCLLLNFFHFLFHFSDLIL